MIDLVETELFELYESQYARDLDGRLIQTEAATLQDLRTIWTVTIDGEKVNVPKAVPATDDQGNIVRDKEGRLVPRLTTIYDAAVLRYTPAPTTEDPAPQPCNPIPILCHQQHMRPIGVCRVCSVLTVREGRPGEKLVPACQHPVVEGMEVHTVCSTATVRGLDVQPAGKYVNKMVNTLVELLAVNYLHYDQPADRPRTYHNELLALARAYRPDLARDADGRLDLATPFKRRPYDPEKLRTDDAFSRVIALDYNNCILCDRCVRGCSEVKPFRIIGHTGFGHAAQISFDLKETMADSGCVSCGECAVSCPTGALTFRRTIYEDRDPWADVTPKPTTVTAEELATRDLFSGVPYAYLKWNEGAVGRLKCQPGTILCREGEYGSTAFLIEKGSIDVVVGGKSDVAPPQTPRDFIVGEMACLSHQPRTATLRAREPSTVLVVRRNLLHMLQRNRTARNILFPIYRRRALASHLRRGKLFEGLDEQQERRCLELLRDHPGVEFVQVDPGQAVFFQGSVADCFYIVHRGHVGVSESNEYGSPLVHGYLGPERHFGEIGLLSGLSDEVGALLPAALRGRRTATCGALDHVELVRIDRAAFQALLAEPAIRARLIQTCRKLLDRRPAARRAVGHRLGEFTATGLYQGQSLLVLDLNKCTRCQECVKACAASHGGVTRLILEGNRFADYLVPSACRSCHDPACLVGCPVDAIHRRPDPRPGSKSLAVFIENHCIGCGLCAHNCPFGSIHMHALPGSAGSERRVAGVKRIATNCDLCESFDGNPQCVHHCPHDAAHRMTGAELAQRIHLTPLGAATGTPR
jgi:Fe-S-cluster-containing hydrogenase component 2/CRP-like cAMP-binding protein